MGLTSILRFRCVDCSLKLHSFHEDAPCSTDMDLQSQTRNPNLSQDQIVQDNIKLNEIHLNIHTQSLRGKHMSFH
jgi:hypothetical protein